MDLATQGTASGPDSSGDWLLFSWMFILVQDHTEGFLQPRMTPEDEFLPSDNADLNVGFDTGTNHIFLVSPVTIVHEINGDSPCFFEADKRTLEGDKEMEVVVILEGMVEATAMNTQFFFERKNCYQVDYSYFNRTYEVSDTPTCSTKELAEKKYIQDSRSSFCYENEVSLQLSSVPPCPDQFSPSPHSSFIRPTPPPRQDSCSEHPHKH